jgi:hypothetical protein
LQHIHHTCLYILLASLITHHGKKTKNRKKIKNTIPVTTDSEEPWEVLEAQILKLEGQLCEIEVQKEAEIAAELEAGRKVHSWLSRKGRSCKVSSGHHRGVSPQLLKLFTNDADAKSAAILSVASAIHIPCEITML